MNKNSFIYQTGFQSNFLRRCLFFAFCLFFNVSVFGQTTSSSDIPSKEQILNFLSKFTVLRAEKGHFVEVNNKIASKASFSLEDDRLVVRCSDGFETYLDLSKDIDYCIWPAGSTLKGDKKGITWQFDEDIYVFQSNPYENCRAQTYENCRAQKGTIWFDTRIDNIGKIKRALKVLATHYKPKDIFY